MKEEKRMQKLGARGSRGVLHTPFTKLNYINDRIKIKVRV